MPGFGGGQFGGRGGGGGGGRGRGPRRNFAESEDPESEQFRKLFIGGLSYDTDEDGVKTHFGQYGEIVDVVVMKDPNTKRSRGFGFVTFGASINVDDAQNARPHKLDGREVETKRAMRREDSGDPDVQQTSMKLFVGGMKEGTDENNIRETFGQYGNIKEVNVVTDKATGKTKGFAFIEFDDYDPVDKCVLIRSFQLNGKNVDVKKAKKKEEGGGGGRGGGGGGRGGRGGGRGGGFGGQNQGGGYQQSGYQSYGGGGGGGYDDGSGYGNYAQQTDYSQGYESGYGGNSGYGGGYAGGQGGGDWSGSFGQGYGGSSGGGPMRGQGYGNQGGGGAPYQSGGGRGGRGRGRGGGGGYQ